MIKKFFYTAGIITTLWSLSSCSGDSQAISAAPVNAIPVTLARASAGSQNAIVASGQIEAIQTADISTRVMGRITNIYVKAGDRVNKGQLLATISDEDIRAKRSQADAVIVEAEAAVASAKKDYERFTNLYKQQSATAKELDNITLQYQSAMARLETARQMRSEVNASLSYSSLVAPFTGVVTRKSAEAGNIASPGMPLLTIEQSGVLQVSASIAESDISQVHTGDVAQLEIKSTGKNFEGKVVQIIPSSQFTGGQYIVKISIPEPAKNGLFAGMYTGVIIPLKGTTEAGSDRLLIPVSAIINRDELTGIYTVSSNNTAMLRWVRLGKNYGNKVEVISGLSKDEPFILSSDGKLYNGAPVAPK